MTERQTYRHVACRPSDNGSIPWQYGCDQCFNFRNDPQPGLSSWMLMLARHMEMEHQIVLVRK